MLRRYLSDKDIGSVQAELGPMPDDVQIAGIKPGIDWRRISLMLCGKGYFVPYQPKVSPLRWENPNDTLQ